jgi:hypothetical protein
VLLGKEQKRFKMKEILDLTKKRSEVNNREDLRHEEKGVAGGSGV